MARPAAGCRWNFSSDYSSRSVVGFVSASTPRPAPEFIAQTLRRWLKQVGVGTLYIGPGSPLGSGFAESFHGELRDQLVDREVFDKLLEAKVLIGRWRKADNTVRPHSSMGYRPPAPESRRPCPLGLAAAHQADRGDPLAGLPW
jgi:transposase InsO family protein